MIKVSDIKSELVVILEGQPREEKSVYGEKTTTYHIYPITVNGAREELRATSFLHDYLKKFRAGDTIEIRSWKEGVPPRQKFETFLRSDSPPANMTANPQAGQQAPPPQEPPTPHPRDFGVQEDAERNYRGQASPPPPQQTTLPNNTRPPQQRAAMNTDPKTEDIHRQVVLKKACDIACHMYGKEYLDNYCADGNCSYTEALSVLIDQIMAVLAGKLK